MARYLDKILVVDVESTCWAGAPPQGQVSEIIEIGLCVVNLDKNTIDENRQIYVKPHQSEVSDFCTKLTGITSDTIKQHGVDFAEAVQLLEKTYLSKSRVWLSWGDYDRRQFERTCQQRQLNYPFGPTHINAKTLFAIQQRLEREVGLTQALERLNIPLEGRHHSGVDDAYNIAKIVLSLF